jgi:hypothetical protein
LFEKERISRTETIDTSGGGRRDRTPKPISEQRDNSTLTERLQPLERSIARLGEPIGGLEGSRGPWAQRTNDANR